MSKVLGYLRLLIVGVSILVLIPFLTKKNGPTLARSWANWIAKLIGVNLEVHGTPAHGVCLYVCNHKSFIDGVAILTQVRTSFVGMAEIQKWPIIGYAAKRIQTVFVQRNNTESRNAAKQAIKEKLLSGYSVMLFPEGKTAAGFKLRRFFPGSFVAACEANVAIVPIAFWFEGDWLSWSEGETFIQNFVRVFSRKQVRIHLAFGAPIFSRDGVEACEQAKKWIQNKLDEVSV